MNKLLKRNTNLQMILKKSVFAFVLSILSFGVNAQGSANGLVEDIVVNRFNHVIIQVENTTSSAGLDGCSGTPTRFVLDITTDFGQAMFSVFLSAESQNREVSVAGAGFCDVRNDTESIRFVRIQN